MSWQTESTVMLRAMIDDLAEIKYTDARLEQILVVCARLVLQELEFAQTYSADVTNITITPDPTTAGAREDSFVNMICLKAACLIDRGETKTSAGQALNIVDTGSRVDLTQIAKARLELLRIGYCAVYEDAKIQYLAGQVRTAGAAIMTPFRVFSGMSGYGNYGATAYDGRYPY